MTGILIRLLDNLVHIRTGSRTRCGKPTTNGTNQTGGGTLCPACAAKGNTHMIYLSPQTSKFSSIPPGWGQLLTPQSKARIVRPGVAWAADNGQFSGKVTPMCFLGWLATMRAHRRACLFAAAPDVVGNAVATLDKYRWYAWRIKALGYPVALVAQDGLEDLPWPPHFDALFVGGSTEWKMSTAADWCIAQAKRRGAWVHVGRVNSQRRIRHFQLVGANSCDGTALAFAPIERMRQLNSAIQQPPLFQMA